MATSWNQAPAHANRHPRPWYKKKRFMLPLGTFVALGVLGSCMEEPSGSSAAQPPRAAVATDDSPVDEAKVDADADALVRASEEAAVLASAEAETQAQARAEAKAQAKAKAKAEARKKARQEARRKRIKDRKAKEARERRAEERRLAEEQAAEDESVDVHYENCDAARAAGAAPVQIGEPGYGKHLDRDGDGTGCDT